MSESREVLHVRRGARVAVAVLALGALAGCADGEALDPPTFGPYTSPVTATPTVTPTPEVAAPARPDLSVVNEETAEALATYFLLLYPYVYATGDLTEWRVLSHPECEFCASVISNVEEMLAKGESARGAETVIGDVQSVKITRDYFHVELTASQGAGFSYGPDGAEIGRSEPGTYHMAVGVVHENGAWSIRVATREARARLVTSDCIQEPQFC